MFWADHYIPQIKYFSGIMDIDAKHNYSIHSGYREDGIREQSIIPVCDLDAETTKTLSLTIIKSLLNRKHKSNLSPN